MVSKVKHTPAWGNYPLFNYNHPFHQSTSLTSFNGDISRWLTWLAARARARCARFAWSHTVSIVSRITIDSCLQVIRWTENVKGHDAQSSVTNPLTRIEAGQTCISNENRELQADTRCTSCICMDCTTTCTAHLVASQAERKGGAVGLHHH